MRNTVRNFSEHESILDHDTATIDKVVEEFAFAVTPQIRQLIDQNDPHDPITKQFIPNAAELTVHVTERADPIGDNTHSKVKGIIHRYPDRCLFTPVMVCAAYCRFCFRREKVGQGEKSLTPNELAAAYQYIENNTNIWEVILSGGDPLIMKPNVLDEILTRLTAIKHVEVIRIHTRVPVVDPQRISDQMVAALKRNKAVFICLHANHPNEFSAAAITTCAKLIDAGIPMLSQSVLLKGVNDNIETLSALMRTFIRNRIKPYYLHQCDLTKGTAHFRTTIAHGQQLMRQLRGRFSGICQPMYVLDIPGGYGKSPIGPTYISEIGSANAELARYQVEDFQGQLHVYP